MQTHFTAAEIRRRYDDLADQYARVEPWQERLLGIGRRTRRGVANMRARADRLGGSMTVADAAAGGTDVTWCVPLR